MASETEIANLALAKLGDEDTIIDINENIRSARSVKAVFAITRDAVLRGHPWNFALARAALPALVEAPGWGFARAFQLPVDCMRLVEVEDNPARRLEGGRLLTDAAAPLRILYVRQVTNTGAFDAAFVDALAGCIALQLAERLTGQTSIRDRLEAQYARYMPRGKTVDGQEDAPELWEEDSWVTARDADD